MSNSTKNKIKKKERQENIRKVLIISLCVIMALAMFLPYLAVFFS